MESWFPEDVLAAFASAIEGIEISSRYARELAPDDAWRETEAPLKLDSEYAEASHLAFELDGSSAFDADGRRIGPTGLHVEMPVTIRFLWQIEVNDCKGSYRRLMAACSTLSAFSLKCPVPGLDVQIPEGAQLWNISADEAGDYYLAEVYITLSYALAR